MLMWTRVLIIMYWRKGKFANSMDAHDWVLMISNVTIRESLMQRAKQATNVCLKKSSLGNWYSQWNWPHSWELQSSLAVFNYKENVLHAEMIGLAKAESFNLIRYKGMEWNCEEQKIYAILIVLSTYALVKPLSSSKIRWNWLYDAGQLLTALYPKCKNICGKIEWPLRERALSYKMVQMQIRQSCGLLNDWSKPEIHISKALWIWMIGCFMPCTLISGRDWKVWLQCLTVAHRHSSAQV